MRVNRDFGNMADEIERVNIANMISYGFVIVIFGDLSFGPPSNILLSNVCLDMFASLGIC